MGLDLRLCQRKYIFLDPFPMVTAAKRRDCSCNSLKTYASPYYNRAQNSVNILPSPGIVRGYLFTRINSLIKKMEHHRRHDRNWIRTNFTLRSFDPLMWTCIGASTLVSLLVFKMITVSLNMLGMSDVMSYSHRGVISTNPWGIRHQIFFVLTTYLDQDCVLPRCTPLRCMAALWLFFTLIITTIYR